METEPTPTPPTQPPLTTPKEKKKRQPKKKTEPSGIRITQHPGKGVEVRFN
jgi:hypothetical protein